MKSRMKGGFKKAKSPAGGVALPSSSGAARAPPPHSGPDLLRRPGIRARAVHDVRHATAEWWSSSSCGGRNSSSRLLELLAVRGAWRSVLFLGGDYNLVLFPLIMRSPTSAVANGLESIAREIPVDADAAQWVRLRPELFERVQALAALDVSKTYG